MPSQDHSCRNISAPGMTRTQSILMTYSPSSREILAMLTLEAKTQDKAITTCRVSLFRQTCRTTISSTCSLASLSKTLLTAELISTRNSNIKRIRRCMQVKRQSLGNLRLIKRTPSSRQPSLENLPSRQGMLLKGPLLLQTTMFRKTKEVRITNSWKRQKKTSLKI